MGYGVAEVPDVATKDAQELAISALRTHNGQRLSPKEDLFIQLYIKHSDPMLAAKEAGYTVKEHYQNKERQWLKRGQGLLAKDYIKDEIAWRMKQIKSAQIADTEEVLMYLTRVMRGEEKDQFNLDVSIADRTSAAKELNRRLHELESASNTEAKTEVHLVLERR